MTYDNCLEWLFSQLPMYQRSGQIAYKASIGNIVQASKQLGNPHRKFKSIHVAGTNGKGSTSHMIASILQEAGYKTGLYTSPHLKDFRERIRINGKKISQQDVVDFMSTNKGWFTKIGMSFFEMTVAMAFDYFAQKKVDIAVIETGLGGRLDSTNIIQPELSIITNIGLDHTALLGNSLKAIAFEKGGIIKKNTPVVIGRKQKEISNVFEAIAKNKNAKLHYAKPVHFTSDLKGNYQSENIATCYYATKLLIQKGWRISDDNCKKGFQNVQKNTALLGRWTILSNNPLTICDTGHNVDSVKFIVQQIQDLTFDKMHFVLGMVKDKSINAILKLLPKQATYYFCQANIPRAMAASQLKNKAINSGLNGEEYPTVKSALLTARNKAKFNDLIFIGGSTYTVAEIL